MMKVGCAFLYTMNLSKCCFPTKTFGCATLMEDEDYATVFKRRMFTTMLPDPLDLTSCNYSPHCRYRCVLPHQTSVLERGGYRFVEP
jgi:hypothetical protein